MKIEVEMVEAFLLNLEGGKTSNARVARVRWQTEPRRPWRTANIIVPDEKASTVLTAAAAYLREQKL